MPPVLGLPAAAVAAPPKAFALPLPADESAPLSVSVLQAAEEAIKEHSKKPIERFIDSSNTVDGQRSQRSASSEVK
jgi:hypothetical protein